eukprot:tig00021281_g19918.t1
MGWFRSLVDASEAKRVAKEAALAAQRTAHAFAETQKSYQAFQEAVIEKLKCPICLEDLSMAVETSCGHAYCAECLLEVVSHQPASARKPACECPVCRSAIASVHPSFALRALVESKEGKGPPDAAGAGAAGVAAQSPPRRPRRPARARARARAPPRTRAAGRPTSRGGSRRRSSGPSRPRLRPPSRLPPERPSRPRLPGRDRSSGAAAEQAAESNAGRSAGHRNGALREVVEAREAFGRWVDFDVMRSRTEALGVVLGAVALLGLYVAMPVDVVPDGIPLVGLIDDYLAIAAAILMVIFACILLAMLVLEHLWAACDAVGGPLHSMRPLLEPGPACALAAVCGVYLSRGNGAHFLPPALLPGLAHLDDALCALLVAYCALAALQPRLALAAELLAARALAAARRSPLSAALVAVLATSALAARSSPAKLELVLAAG